MDCILTSSILDEITQTQNALERLDTLFSEKFNPSEGVTVLNPSPEFMAAWHKIKNARQTLLSIQLENEVEA
jgi:hypothetical protein